VTTELPSNELELTELELNRIFFGSEDSVEDDNVSSDISDDDFIEDHITKNIEKKTIKLDSIKPRKSNKPQKLKRKNKPADYKEDKLESDEPKEVEGEVEKPKRGRPVKWTPEKIAQKKEENKRIAKLKRIERQERLRIAQLSGNLPTSEYEKNQKIERAVKTQEEIEKHIVEKRTKLKEAIGRQSVVILDRKSKCKEHLFKVNRLESTTNNPITACVHCSKERVFTAHEWRSYIVKHKGEL